MTDSWRKHIVCILKASFILDTGPAGVFIWVGKKCRMNEKKAAISNAMVRKPFSQIFQKFS